LLTLEEQVEKLVGFDIPDGDKGKVAHDIGQGCQEISNRMRQLDHMDMDSFTFTTEITDRAGVPYTGDIISIVRENGVKGKFEVCTPIPPHDRYLATDTDSLKFRSKYNPAYYILHKNGEYDGDGDTSMTARASIYIIPTPNSSNNERGWVSQVPHYSFEVAMLLFNEIPFFPPKYNYAAVLYAAIQILERRLVNFAVEDEDDEMVVIMQEALKNYKTQYDEVFAFKGADKKQQGQQ